MHYISEAEAGAEAANVLGSPSFGSWPNVNVFISLKNTCAFATRERHADTVDAQQYPPKFDSCTENVR